MPYEIKEKNGSFYVVDTETNRIRGTYNTEDDAEDRVDELNFRAEIRSGVSRIPNKELTPEEKAAKYDEMMAKENESKDKNVPTKKEEPEKVEPKPKGKRSLYWGDLDDN